MTDQNSQFFAILTNVGAAKQANADALGVPWKITQMGVGDANEKDFVPLPEQTALINEQRRAPLNELKVDPANTAIIIAEQVIPAEVGGWWIREIGLYDADGDLVAVANCAPSFKPLLMQGSGRTQVIRLNIQVSNSSNVELKIDPSVVLATRDYVDRIRIKILGELATRIFRVDTSRALSRKEMGLVLIDAREGDRTISLPSSKSVATADVLVQRVDNSGNRLEIKAYAGDRVKFHTHLNPEGYPFFVLMGAGDWWHLRSDGRGSWWLIGRYDGTSVGRSVMETTLEFPPGGYGAPNGPLLKRSEWPWLWDHAQRSGMVVSEAARVGHEGGWTQGDGKTTFRAPEIRGEWLRILDETRGVDAGRAAGSWQDGTWIRTVAQEWSGLDTPYGTHQIGNAFAGADGRIVNGGPGGQRPAGARTPSGASVLAPEVSDNTITGTAALDVTSQVNNWIRFRPRNIAYPARIKLI
ncbi:phage tail protein [Pseudomonas sp. W2Oct36]|uniref:phage tail protein n=1 Tax=Pseudomonas sp. W2Oct36 TaxID=1215284 RepID=UPI0034E05FA2